MGVEPAVPIDIGSRRELFLDDVLIERMMGATLRLNRPLPAGPVLAFDRPWEGPTSAYVSVFEDQGRFRLYYRGSPAAGSPAVTGLAESVDGVHWTRPRVGLHQQAEWPENNIVWVGEEAHNMAPFLDGNPEAPAEARYKALGGRPPRAMASSDGIRWRLLREEPLFADGRFDSQNIAFWHPLEGRYVGYVRDWRDGRRAIARTISEDFLTWSDPEPIEIVDVSLPEELYTNATLPYPQAPHLLVSFPQRFVPQRQVIPDAPLPGVSDCLLMSSRDGRIFRRPFAEAFLSPGPDRRNWADRSNAVAWGLLRTGDAELSLYVTRHYRHPTAHLDRLTVRLDGLASINASGAGGEAITRPLRFTGRALHLNYATSAAGGIRVEIQDAGGVPVAHRTLSDCHDLVGDEIDGTVRWRDGEDLGALAGTPIRLRFRLCDADLYALRFGG